MQTRYSAYGSAAAEWYGARSKAIEDVKKECRVAWGGLGIWIMLG